MSHHHHGTYPCYNLESINTYKISITFYRVNRCHGVIPLLHFRIYKYFKNLKHFLKLEEGQGTDGDCHNHPLPYHTLVTP